MARRPGWLSFVAWVVVAVAGRAAGAAPAVPAAAPTVTLRLLDAAPNPRHPEVLVRVPPTFAAGGPVNVVVFLHGWRTCVAVVAAAADAPCRPGGPPRPAMDLVGQFDAARVNALLVVPQLAFDAPSSDPGRLGAPGGLRRLLAAVLAAPALAPALGQRRDLAALGRVVVFAHSGAIVPLYRVLLDGGVPVSEAHLLDALYRHADEIYAWARGHLAAFVPGDPRSDRLTFVYTDRERTGPGTRRLVARLGRLLPPARAARTIASYRRRTPLPPPDLWRVPIVAARTALDHDLIPRRLLVPLLAASPLHLVVAPPVSGSR